VEEPVGEVQALPTRAPKVAVVEVDEPPEPNDDGPKIVSLDKFRKK
jgi:hypothetical protein